MLNNPQSRKKERERDGRVVGTNSDKDHLSDTKHECGKCVERREWQVHVDKLQVLTEAVDGAQDQEDDGQSTKHGVDTKIVAKLGEGLFRVGSGPPAEPDARENLAENVGADGKDEDHCWDPADGADVADSLALASTKNNTLTAYSAEISFGQLSEVLLQSANFQYFLVPALVRMRKCDDAVTDCTVHVPRGLVAEGNIRVRNMNRTFHDAHFSEKCFEKDQKSAKFARDVQLFLTHSLDPSTKHGGQTTHLDTLHTSQHLGRDRDSPLDGLEPDSLTRHDEADSDHRAND
ncbi:hypothetical protein HG530_001554 [Fusarium avenaceum]|nr:hypothetical protein HG530_001554 [Fusarium avenaceum]